ncbi:hypothetical protein [Geothrix sp. SG200]|uniref:hypothetical protein n=1 Tax=Geothrix sp. SG200 TaxID=2922865 RepID=UPI001FABFC0B|nr:hypothetical protein [Geothrix sp. SG200]
MHLVMPWFFPFAALAAWLGLRAARALWNEGEGGRTSGWWMLILMLLPFFFWLIAQIQPREGMLR